jgi:hypothetical protein
LRAAAPEARTISRGEHGRRHPPAEGISDHDNNELTEDEALSLRNLLDVAIRHEGMRAAIFAVTLDAKNWVKAIQKTLSWAAFKNQTDTRAELSSIMHTETI